MERIDEPTPRTNHSRVVIGLVLITLAVLLFAENFDIIPGNWHSIVFTWQMLIILIGVISLVKNESRVTGIVLIVIGIFFLLAKIYYFPFGIRHLFWPTILAAIGVILLLKRRSYDHSIFSGKTGISSEDFIDDVAIFGGSVQKIKSRNFRGGKITNIFGGSTFDLLDAQLAPGQNIIDVFCLFGGSKFIVPANWKVRIEVTSIFGGFSDKRKSISSVEQGNNSELVYKGTVIFGGGELKNL